MGAEHAAGLGHHWGWHGAAVGGCGWCWGDMRLWEVHCATGLGGHGGHQLSPHPTQPVCAEDLLEACAVPVPHVLSWSPGRCRPVAFSRCGSHLSWPGEPCLASASCHWVGGHFLTHWGCRPGGWALCGVLGLAVGEGPLAMRHCQPLARLRPRDGRGACPEGGATAVWCAPGTGAFRCVLPECREACRAATSLI